MKTKNIFKTLALAMLMPAMLLTTACSSEDDLTNNTVNSQPVAKKGYALPVTVSATREGDKGSNRASFDGSKLNFSTGDKLYVGGLDEGGAGIFSGTLDYDAVSGKFSGTIYTENKYEGTADALFTAAGSMINASLLPAGYEDYGYLGVETEGNQTIIAVHNTYTFATSKAAGVEQFSMEKALGYSSGFALAPQNAILNFTITGLAASTSVNVSLTSGDYNITGTVTTDGSGTATFAAGIYKNEDLNDFSLTVAGNPVTLVTESKTLAAGKIYNITRIAAPTIPAVALSGLFSVSATQQARFSQGNLQAVCTSADGDASTQETFTWRFAEHQWDYIGGNYSGGALTPTGNNFINGSGSVSAAGTVDLFSWVGGSSSLTGVAAYGICLWGVGGNVAGEDLKFDWGSIFGGSWRMPSKEEWNYVINTRSTTSGVRYAKAKVNGVSGIILLPDDWNTSYYALSSTNTSNAAFSANNIDASTWTNSLEAHGAVFLPAAGDRSFGNIWNQNSYGTYWSNSSDAENAANAYCFRFSKEDGVQTQYAANRGYGVSVRLICPVHP